MIFGSDPSVLLKSTAESRDALFNLNYLQDIQEKGTYAKFTYLLAKLWIVLLFFVVLAQGFGGRGNSTLEVLRYRSWWANFHLSEAEFIAFITSTTATVLGLAYLVGRYLFVQKSSNDGNAPVSSKISFSKPSVSSDPPISPIADPLPPPKDDQGDIAEKIDEKSDKDSNEMPPLDNKDP